LTSPRGGSAKCSRTGKPSPVSNAAAASARAARGRSGAGLALRLVPGGPVGLLGGQAALAKGDADMPSQAMQDLIDAFRDRQQASAGQAPPTLEERRASFAPRTAFLRC
jgi:hypothetical protein